ncbi:MAG: carbohydrate-binding protein [Halobacteriota archaeon]
MTYDGVTYDVLQGHTTQADWTPPTQPRRPAPPSAVETTAKPVTRTTPVEKQTTTAGPTTLSTCSTKSRSASPSTTPRPATSSK